MKLNESFVIHDAGKDSLLVPMGNADFSGIVKGNKTLREILELLKTETTEDKVIKTMHVKYDALDGAIERDVRNVIKELQKIGALDE